MTPRRIALAVGALMLVIALAIFLIRRHSAGPGDQGDATPTATITTALVSEETVEDTATAYGVVEADPAAVTTIAAPRAIVVSAILVRPGQAVGAGQAVAEVASAPAATLAYRQAADATNAAQLDLARVQRLFDAHLAASDQLIAAKKALADALSALAAQQKQGAGLASQTLTAPQASVVTSIPSAPGDRLAQDAPVLVLARTGALSVKLGLEPSSSHVAAGDPVTLSPVAGGPSLESRLRMVGHAADPATKTVDALAPLPGAAFPIGAAVRADVVTGRHRGLLVPRAAVVFDETGSHLFTVVGGKARRVFVTVGRDHGSDLEVSGSIHAGDVVAVEGAYELQDGMAVKVASR